MTESDASNSSPPSAIDAMQQYLDEEIRSQPEGGHGHGDHETPMESVREATHAGHHIVVRTSYRIEVDGKPLAGRFYLSNDGQVFYHGLPNYSFASAVDLVKQMIDAFPDDFETPDDGPGHHDHDHPPAGGQGHGQSPSGGHDHGQPPPGGHHR